MYNFLKKKSNYDITIVGGGIVGLATARKLINDNPYLKCVLVEKENQLGFCDLNLFYISCHFNLS